MQKSSRNNFVFQYCSKGAINNHPRHCVKTMARSTLGANRSNEPPALKIIEGMRENIRAIAEGKEAEKEQGGGGGRFLFRGRGHPAAPGVEVSPL